MKIVVALLAILLTLSLNACGKPNGISDEDYAAYKELGAPKILFSCTSAMDDHLLASRLISCGAGGGKEYEGCTDKAMSDKDKPMVNVGYTAGIGMNATYNKILGDAKSACNGKFELLDSKQ